MYMRAPFPSSDGPSARNTLLYRARLGARSLHFQNALWLGTGPEYTASSACSRTKELLIVMRLSTP